MRARRPRLKRALLTGRVTMHDVAAAPAPPLGWKLRAQCAKHSFVALRVRADLCC